MEIKLKCFNQTFLWLDWSSNGHSFIFRRGEVEVRFAFFSSFIAFFSSFLQLIIPHPVLLCKAFQVGVFSLLFLLASQKEVCRRARQDNDNQISILCYSTDAVSCSRRHYRHWKARKWNMIRNRWQDGFFCGNLSSSLWLLHRWIPRKRVWTKWEKEHNI